MKIRLDYADNLHFKAAARNFKNIPLDEPKSFHGTNKGPSSVEYLLIGIGGCLGSTFVHCLRKYDLSLKQLEIIVDGNLKHIGPNMRLKLINVKVSFQYSMEKEASKEDLEKCTTIFKEHCVILEPLLEGIPIKLEFSLIR